MSFDPSSSYVNRVGTPSVKWDKGAIKSICNNSEALPFWVADMDFKSPLSVINELTKAAEHGVFGYPSFKNIKSSFIKWASYRHNWKVDSSLLLPFSGMLSSIATLIELYSKEGDKIILPMPAYKPFVRIITLLNREVASWPMVFENGQFQLDFEKFDELVKSTNSPILLFCSPHNPTGRVFSEDELNKVAQISSKHKIVVLSDEIHSDLTYPNHTHIPFDIVAKKYNLECATCISPSKTFNIAGEHFSYVVSCSSEMHNTLSSRQSALGLNPSLLGTTLALAAYDGGKKWLEDLLIYLEKESNSIKNAFEHSGTGLKFILPEASFIGLIDCSSIYDKVVLDSKNNPFLYDESISPEGGLLSRFFGQRASIAMNDGSWFGDNYKTYVRLNFATNKESIDLAIKSIIKAATDLLNK
ncbi:MAG: MalY/PatB family protein [Sphaerochaetaceae bacterium]|jgi:cystathionine beta-lyase